MNRDRAITIIVIMAVATVCALSLGTLAVCISYAEEIVSGRFVCDRDNRVYHLLLMVVATALLVLRIKWGAK